jgi:hypothetical protein
VSGVARAGAPGRPRGRRPRAELQSRCCSPSTSESLTTLNRRRAHFPAQLACSLAQTRTHKTATAQRFSAKPLQALQHCFLLVTHAPSLLAASAGTRRATAAASRSDLCSLTVPPSRPVGLLTVPQTTSKNPPRLPRPLKQLQEQASAQKGESAAAVVWHSGATVVLHPKALHAA